jgi:predicted nucleotidyltransferase
MGWVAPGHTEPIPPALEETLWAKRNWSKAVRCKGMVNSAESQKRRPGVKLDSRNLIDGFREHLRRVLPRFRAIKGVLGIVLTGGMSRGYVDHLSELDLTLYLDSDSYRRWQEGRAPIPSGIVVLDGQLFDIKIVDLQEAREAEWDNLRRWEASYAELLHDPEGLIADLYRNKLADPAQDTSSRVGGLLFETWWYFRLAGRCWLHRGDALQAHLVLNRAVEKLIEALFVANDEYVPHAKWLAHLSRSLNWKPNNWERRLAEAVTVCGTELDSARTRMHVVESLWEEIDGHVVSTKHPGFPLSMMQKRHYDLLFLLNSRGRVTLEEWKQRAPATMLNEPPFSSCVRVEGDQVKLDRKLLEAVQPDDMYEWHYEIVEAVRRHN